MNSIISLFVRIAASIPAAATVWLVSFFAFNQTFLLSSVISVAGAGAVWLTTSAITKARFLKRNRLTRKEYRYIKANLDEAKQKISRLHKTLFNIRNLSSLKERIDLLRMIRKIYSMSKKEPRRFYEAEQFYFSHLDSILELSEKYAFLSTQPRKNRELDQSLVETRRMLDEFTQTVEKDLYQVISVDIDQLNFEIDVAKHTLKKKNDTKFLDENRRIK